MVICEWWSSVLVLQKIWLLEGSDDGYHFLSRKNFFWEAAPCGLWEGKYFFWYMKIYYYCAFIIRMYELGLSFLLLYKVKTDTLATLITLKWTPGMSPIACSLWPKPATRTSSFSSIKFKQPSLSIKAVIFFFFFNRSWLVEPWHTSWWQNLAVWFQPLLFRAQFPWHKTRLRKGWPSVLCPHGLSCTVSHTTSGLVSGYGASWQDEDCDTCPSCQHHRPEWKEKHFIIKVYTLSFGHNAITLNRQCEHLYVPWETRRISVTCFTAVVWDEVCSISKGCLYWEWWVKGESFIRA